MKLSALTAVAFLAGGSVGWAIRGRVAQPENPGRATPEAATVAELSAADRAGIEKLHQQNVAAALTQDPEDLARLWDTNAVRLEAGSPAEIGRQVIHADDVKERAAKPSAKTIRYEPHLEELQIAGGWAFEWDEFDASFRLSPWTKIQSIWRKALRVLRRQDDGSWKFARVIVVLDGPLPSAGERR